MAQEEQDAFEAQKAEDMAAIEADIATQLENDKQS